MSLNSKEARPLICEKGSFGTRIFESDSKLPRMLKTYLIFYNIYLCLLIKS